MEAFVTLRLPLLAANGKAAASLRVADALLSMSALDGGMSASERSPSPTKRRTWARIGQRLTLLARGGAASPTSVAQNGRPSDSVVVGIALARDLHDKGDAPDRVRYRGERRQNK